MRFNCVELGKKRENFPKKNREADGDSRAMTNQKHLEKKRTICANSTKKMKIRRKNCISPEMTEPGKTKFVRHSQHKPSGQKNCH